MLYQEKHRPQLHFTPKENWINDPNGLVYYEGEYHLFYQRNPHSNDHADMHWGHATSTDLYHWEEHGIALAPDELGTIFSGSAVVDKNNTSGLFESASGGLVAIFTHDGESQQQSIAYSEDKGRTWIKYEGNPVIPNTKIKDFRDPKVSWHEDSKKWVMALACGDHIQFYNSPNLIDWTYLSSFGKEYPSHIGVWECPDLLYLPVEGSSKKEWVLIVSINADGPNGGSAVYYFTGSFDGKVFHPNEKPEDALKWADAGKDFYAAVSWDNTEDTYWIGWMSNWQYAGVMPVSPWRSAMSLARKISLYEKDGNLLLKQTPVIADNRKEAASYQDVTIQPDTAESYAISDTAQIDLRISEASSSTKWGVKFVTDQEEVFQLAIDTQENTYTFYRTEGMIDFSEEFPEEIKGTLNGLDVQNLTAIVDRSSVELFLNNGLTVSTNLIYPQGTVTQLEVFAVNDVLQIDNVSWTQLKSIWN
ncbi:glycoside hydrolase family 32 protein [Oceanobacillus sp. CFH 90083]|uniref:glycoside hydrolase family 32 protein n=1 Tax=Oceanobacillus sp. CFH 90083 TaxID=2592336 RepID=UPI00128B0FD3|nr:glycoside hydrolase family 32 protein [Oceanobacillus sp. CFH 90083]